MEDNDTIITFLVNSFGTQSCFGGFLEGSMLFPTKREAIAWLIDHVFEKTTNHNAWVLTEPTMDGYIQTTALITSITNRYRPDQFNIYRTLL